MSERGADACRRARAGVSVLFPKGLFVVGLCGVGLVVSGCGGGGPAKHAVSGRVTFVDGSPLTKGIVVFASPSGNSRGVLDADGRYALGTAAARDGAVSGLYRVFLAGPIFRDDPGQVGEYLENAERSEALVNPKFGDPTTSELSCEVAGRTTFDFTVSRP